MPCKSQARDLQVGLPWGTLGPSCGTCSLQPEGVRILWRALRHAIWVIILEQRHSGAYTHAFFMQFKPNGGGTALQTQNGSTEQWVLWALEVIC